MTGGRLWIFRAPVETMELDPWIICYRDVDGLEYFLPERYYSQPDAMAAAQRLIDGAAA